MTKQAVSVICIALTDEGSMCSSRPSRTSSCSSLEIPRDENRTVKGRVNSLMLTDPIHIHRQINETKHCSVQYTTPHLSTLCEKETKTFHAKSTKSTCPKYSKLVSFTFLQNVRRVEGKTSNKKYLSGYKR